MNAAARRPDRSAALLGWMGSLADPTRLRLLRVLERDELSVQELCGVLKLPQSTVSRHLKTLSDEGWLSARREGTQSFYRLAAALADAARGLWKLARAETDGWPAAQQDAVRLEARLRERRSEAERYFAGKAAEWDRVRSEAYGQGFEHAILRALPPPEWTIADLGCGTGSFTLELARTGAHVIAVDQSAAMLKYARRSTRGLDNVEIRQASLEALPIPDRSSDVALLVLALSYVSEVEPVLREAFRILKPGGRLFAVDAVAHGDEALRRRLGQVRPGIDTGWLHRTLAAIGFDRAGVGWPINTPRTGQPGPDLFLAQGTRPRARS
ncbi:MAG TPA: metalloregulator ArsR/SmtB family transcription factor [Anaeromyxobacteraceae bacterium]|nr:metalloregulator ArsR/SmtB family transcription factor [Anaeromyxobacteraceae bacterium]